MGGDTQLNNILQCFYAANRTSSVSTEGKDSSVQRGSLLGREAQGICGTAPLGQLIDVKGDPKGALEQLYKAFEQAEKPRLGSDAHKVQEMARNTFKSLEHVTAENVASFRDQLDSMARERGTKTPHESTSEHGAQRPKMERSDSKISLASLLSQLGDDDSDSDSDDDEPMRPQLTRQRSLRSTSLLESLGGLKKEQPTKPQPSRERPPLLRSGSSRTPQHHAPEPPVSQPKQEPKTEPFKQQFQPDTPINRDEFFGHEMPDSDSPPAFDPAKQPRRSSIHRTDSTASLHRSVQMDDNVQHIEGDSSIERTVFEKPLPESVTEQVQELAENLELIYQDGTYDYATNFRPLATLAGTIAEYDPSDMGSRNVSTIRSMLASPVLANLETHEFDISKAENLYKRSVHSFSPEFRAACENLDRVEGQLRDIRATADKLSAGIRRNRRRSFLGTSSKSSPALTRTTQQEERLAAEVDKAQSELAAAKTKAPAHEVALRNNYEQVPQQRRLLETLLEIREGLEDSLLE